MEQVIGSVSACLTVQRLPGKSVKIILAEKRNEGKE